MSDYYVHGCWVTGADRVCEDGTKGCSREHPLRDSVVCECCERCRTTNPERLCDYCKTLPRPPTMSDRLRALADHLETRPFAPSLDGYDLADGLRAAADLLDGKPGPSVHSDVAVDVAANTPRHALPRT